MPTNHLNENYTELTDAISLVDEYLKTSEAEGMASVAHLLAEDVLIIWPGGRKTEGKAAALAAAPSRYRSLHKNRDHYAAARISNGTIEVTGRGRLYGETKAGVRFEDIRYVDVFVIDRGQIHEQHVWSDVAISGILDTSPQ